VGATGTGVSVGGTGVAVGGGGGGWGEGNEGGDDWNTRRDALICPGESAAARTMANINHAIQVIFGLDRRYQAFNATRAGRSLLGNGLKIL
jgi:hypothetical protein